jgi:hypothetical protein
MSLSNKTKNSLNALIKDETGWADFFITRIGLLLFTSVLFLMASEVYPVFQEREAQAYLDVMASDIVSDVEAIEGTTIPGYRYVYSFDEINKNIKIEISTEYVISRMNRTSLWGDRELVHAEPLIIHVYPPNCNWSNVSGFREYVSRVIGNGKSGDAASPLNLSIDKEGVDMLLDSVNKELAKSPFLPDMEKPMIVEKVIMYYTDRTGTVESDYVFVYQ